MQVFNTFSSKLEKFTPLVPGQVKIYVCGPTVYNDIHIGNARTFIVFDMVRRYLEYAGFNVTYVQNLTDVDDKIINAAKAAGQDTAGYATKYSDNFMKVCQLLDIKPPSIQPRATGEINEMIALITQLIEKGHAYEAAGSVYFSVRSWPEYGQLSGRNVDDLLVGARVEVDEDNKQDPLDFAMWKAAKPGEPHWNSPWGPGRPGWHIECSAMAGKYLGRKFDIHAGGSDLIFPHHENELAQSCAAQNDRSDFAQYWLHSGMLNINSDKMSKSTGNFLLAKDIAGQVPPPALRLLMMQTHYRSTFDYSPERLTEAKAAYGRIINTLERALFVISQANNDNGGNCDIGDDGSAAGNLTESIKTAQDTFVREMDNDFNTPKAVAAIYDLIGQINSVINQDKSIAAQSLKKAVDTTIILLQAIGVRIDIADIAIDTNTTRNSNASTSQASQAIPEEIMGVAASFGITGLSNSSDVLQELIELRKAARADKNYKLADEIRDAVERVGLEFKDTAQGTQISVRN